MKIGIFDSGIGGVAVARSVREAFPDADVTVVNDREHVPYGDRTHEEIQFLTDSAIQPLIEQSCDIIIIACNTATAVAIDWLRETYPQQKFIGLEPTINPAVNMTKSGVIAICATPATLASDRYQSLKTKYATHVTVLEPDCRTWARMIEHNQLNKQHIRDTISTVVEQQADIIVLACTHYHWIRELIEDAAGTDVIVIDPSNAIVARVESLLQSNQV